MRVPRRARPVPLLLLRRRLLLLGKRAGEHRQPRPRPRRRRGGGGGGGGGAAALLVGGLETGLGLDSQAGPVFRGLELGLFFGGCLVGLRAVFCNRQTKPASRVQHQHYLNNTPPQSKLTAGC